jgi:hypothetical protein
MKITVDIDCTPGEARQFMGLPDLEPLQKHMPARRHPKKGSAKGSED